MKSGLPMLNLLMSSVCFMFYQNPRSAHKHYIYIFCVDFRTNSDYFPIQR